MHWIFPGARIFPDLLVARRTTLRSRIYSMHGCHQADGGSQVAMAWARPV
jgi:hypothetical protein